MSCLLILLITYVETPSEALAVRAPAEPGSFTGTRDIILVFTILDFQPILGRGGLSWRTNGEKVENQDILRQIAEMLREEVAFS